MDGFCSTSVLKAALMVCGSMSIARHVGGIEMVKPSAAREIVVHPDGSGLFVGDGDGLGLGVGVGLGDGDATALGDEQLAASSSPRISTRRVGMRPC